MTFDRILIESVQVKSDNKAVKYIGVDWDKTLAVHATGEGLNPADILNQPLIEPMKNRVRMWLTAGREVRIITARAGVHLHIPDYDIDLAIKNIQDNLEKNELPRLVVQNHKCNLMEQLWDDRAMPVEPNTGVALGVKFDQISTLDLMRLQSRIGEELRKRTQLIIDEEIRTGNHGN